MIIFANFILLCILGLIDLSTGSEISFSIFYLLPITITAWFKKRIAALLISIFSACIWLAADLGAGHKYSSVIIPYWNALMRLGVFATIVYLLCSLKDKTHKLHQVKLQKETDKAIVHTSQSIVKFLAENITTQNAEIIKWINLQKHKGKQVPLKIENASNNISLSMNMLTEASFLDPYVSGFPGYVVDLSKVLENKLTTPEKSAEKFKHYAN